MPAGISAPFGYFDPAGLGKKVSEQRAKYFRECELKHGRVAMLAAFGFPVAEHFHPLFGGNIDVPSCRGTPLQTFWRRAALRRQVEIFSVFTFETQGRLLTQGRPRPRRFWLGPHGLLPSTPRAHRDASREQRQSREDVAMVQHERAVKF